jgi:hypothetical protein
MKLPFFTALIGMLLTSAAQALPITLTPPIAAVGTLNDADVNGTYEALGPSSGSQSIGGARSVGGVGIVDPRRSMVVEFASPLIPAGATLVGATLFVDDVGGSNSTPQFLNVFLYSGNGLVSTADASQPGAVLQGSKTNVGGFGLAGADPQDLNLSLDVGAVTGLLNAGATHLGFFIGPNLVLTSGSSDILVLTGNPTIGDLAPRLSLQFETPSAVPAPGTLALLGIGLAALRVARRAKSSR